MATGRMAMRTAAGLACSFLIVFLLTAGFAGCACSQQQQPSFAGADDHGGWHYGTKRRLLNYDDLRRMRLDETTDGNSSTPSSYSQGNSSSPSYSQGNSSSPNWSTRSSSSKKSAMKYVVPIIICSVVALALVVALVFWWVGHSRRSTPQLGRAANDEETPPPNTNNKQARDNSPKSLTLKEIKHATHNFQVKLGEGAFGKVYLGNLKGIKIAVKQLAHESLNVSTEQFKREMGILMQVKHKNLVNFLAYCDEGDNRFLCFEFLSGGSLDKLLYASKLNESKKSYVRGNDMLLDWARRYYIIKEVCTGLHYLHAEWDKKTKILHLDLKAGNILIDHDGEVVKIADFGISRLLGADITHKYVTDKYTIAMPAYMPKECLPHNKPKVSAKVDIYSYGMLLLEIVTGWCATDEDFRGVPTFIEMACKASKNGDVKEVLDPTLLEGLDDRGVAEVLKCIKIACDCLNDDPNQRPDTKQITQRLDS